MAKRTNPIASDGLPSAQALYPRRPRSFGALMKTCSALEGLSGAAVMNSSFADYS